MSDSLPRRGGLRRAGDLQAAGPPSRTALRSVRSHNRAIDRNVFRSGSGKYACAAVQNTGCLIAINGRPAMARREGIGLHLPAAHGSVARDGIALLGRSAHDEEEVQRAVAEGVDYLIVGTIFPSASKPGRAPLGLDGLARLTALAAPLPVFAIGGITPTRVASVLEAGAHGVAVCSAVLDVPDAAVATQNFLAELPT
ncbi:MAG: thiamine phosphate synthase [Gammaproteobacteria bacterium]|nr:thiamine phosphate synthase [Gammaproteobacteria bacterium]